MKTKKINCCKDCPYYDGSDREIAQCLHKNGKTGYEYALSRSHFKPDPMPKWCPLKDKNTNHMFVKRNINDEIIQQILLVPTNHYEK